MLRGDPESGLSSHTDKSELAQSGLAAAQHLGSEPFSPSLLRESRGLSAGRPAPPQAVGARCPASSQELPECRCDLHVSYCCVTTYPQVQQLKTGSTFLNSCGSETQAAKLGGSSSGSQVTASVGWAAAPGAQWALRPWLFASLEAQRQLPVRSQHSSAVPQKRDPQRLGQSLQSCRVGRLSHGCIQRTAHKCMEVGHGCRSRVRRRWLPPPHL